MIDIEKQKITFEYLNCGDDCLDTIFFIKQMFEQKQLSKRDRDIIINYFLQDNEKVDVETRIR